MGVDLHAFYLDFIYSNIFTNISTEISFIPPIFPVFRKKLTYSAKPVFNRMGAKPLTLQTFSQYL
jgi:hypothetical protein